MCTSARLRSACGLCPSAPLMYTSYPRRRPTATIQQTKHNASCLQRHFAVAQKSTHDCANKCYYLPLLVRHSNKCATGRSGVVSWGLRYIDTVRNHVQIPPKADDSLSLSLSVVLSLSRCVQACVWKIDTRPLETIVKARPHSSAPPFFDARLKHSLRRNAIAGIFGIRSHMRVCVRMFRYV